MNRVRRIETWARAGYAARGMVYLLLGWIALSSGKALSTGETVEAVRDLPAGTLLLAMLTVGLFGYGLYKIYSAAVDLDSHGREPKGLAIRGGRMAGGLAYFLLAGIAARQWLRDRPAAVEAGRPGGSSDLKQEAARQVAEATGGDLLLTIAGLAVIGVAVAQLVIAARAKFADEMPGAPAFVRPAGQLGYAARAVVVAMVGWFLFKAGIDGERLRNFGDALALLRDSRPLLFKGVAGGLALFGLTSLMMARYRRIADDDVVDRVSGKMRELAP